MNRFIEAMNFLVSLLFAAQRGALSFSPSNILSIGSRKSPRMRKSRLVRMALSDLGDLVSSLPSKPKSTEFWLDLRGTAVHPGTAVDYILEDLEEEGLLFPYIHNTLIEKVLISDFSFQQLLNVSDPFVEASEILYRPEGTNDGFLASSRSGLSLPFGNIFLMPNDNAVAVGDPMMAMRLLGEGKWIVLQNDGQLDPDKESLRMNAISGFLDIASTASAGEWGASVMQTGNDNDNELVLQRGKATGSAQQESGGVAVHCPTKSFLLQLASVLRCFQSVSTTTMTDSGIIIQGGSEVYVPSLPTAVILPFDLQLWKTAMLVYGGEQFRALE